MRQICSIPYYNPRESASHSSQTMMESRMYGSLSNSKLRIQNDKTKTDEEKIEELTATISEIEQNQRYSQSFKDHLVIGYEQQKLQLLLNSKQARQLTSIEHISSQISVDNPEVLYYVLSENLRRDQRRSLLITPRSSNIGLESTFFPQASNYKCYKLHMKQGDFSIFTNDKKKIEFTQAFEYQVSKSLQVPQDQIKVLDIVQGSIIVHFTILQDQLIKDQQVKILNEVFNGSVEVYNYFAGDEDNQLVGLSPEDFAPQYNMEWDIDFQEKEERGPPYHRYDYYFPRGYNGYALNVLKEGQDDRWIDMDGNDQEWRILYHGTNHNNIKNIVKRGLIPGARQQYEEEICVYTNQPVGQGVYFSDRVEICEDYAEPTLVGDKQFILIFQSRVNPRAIKQSLVMQEENYFVVNNSEDIRPYRILLREI